MPGISIVMPFRNAAATLPEALVSVRAQTFTDWELLAVDDRSTDDSAAVVREFAAGDQRVHLLENQSSRGVVLRRRRAERRERTGWRGWMRTTSAIPSGWSGSGRSRGRCPDST